MYPLRVKEADLDRFGASSRFYSSVLQKYWLKKYHVENWNIIIDLENAGITNFPLKAMKSMTEVSSLAFCGRLNKMLIFDPSFFFFGLWKLIKVFLHADTLAKIIFVKKSKHQDIFKYFDKEQIIQKYGGTLKTPLAPFPIFLGPEIPEAQPTPNTKKQEHGMETVSQTFSVKSLSSMIEVLRIPMGDTHVL